MTRRLTPLALFALWVLPIAAQTNGSIGGTVTDPSSAAIPAAAVALTNLGTGQSRQAVSSSDGYFSFTDLQAGRYSLKVSAQGFKELVQEDLVLNVGQQMTVRPTLTVGSVSEVVEVTGAPPPVTTTTSTVSHLVDSQRIDRLPLNGRNALQLVALVPGVVDVGRYGQFGATQISFQVAGGRRVDMNFNLDGGFNMNAFYNNANDIRIRTRCKSSPSTPAPIARLSDGDSTRCRR